MAAIVSSQLSIFNIESKAFPDYNLAQLGTQVLLMKSNKDDPKQLWYRDDSWQFTDSFVLINMATKMALKSPPSSDLRVQKVLVGPYDPSITETSILWYSSSSHDKVCWIRSRLQGTRALGLGVSRTNTPDGIPAVIGSDSTEWKFTLYEPRSFNIQSSWVNQLLTYKTPYQTVQYYGMVAPGQTDGNNVVGINPNEASADVRARQIWYRIPAGGQEDTNNYTSFIIINKSTGLALKGSSKPGEKVLAVEFDPLDYDFVWAEDREKAGDTRDSVNINLSKSGATNLYWCFPTDSSFQNAAWYHPLTVSGGSWSMTWRFIPVSS